MDVIKVLLSLFFQIIILNLLKFKLLNFKNLAVMPRNWALVGISVHNFYQRFTQEECTQYLVNFSYDFSYVFFF